MSSIKTYVEASSGQVFLAVTYRGKRFYVYTGLKSTEKFTGIQFPRSQSSWKVKSVKLASLTSDVEKFMLLNDDKPFEFIKDNVKAIVSGAECIKKTLLFLLLLSYFRN